MTVKQLELKTAIKGIAQKHGVVTPQLVVNEARDPTHPLHNEFDWDDASAANQHRLAVARALLRQIEYIGRDIVGRPVQAVGYVHEPGVKSQSYVPLSGIAKSRAKSVDLLNQEVAQCEAMIHRAQRIADVIHMRAELDVLLHAVIDGTQPPPKSTKKRGKTGAVTAEISSTQ